MAPSPAPVNTLPRDLYGRDRPDRSLRGLTVLLNGSRWLMGRSLARSAASPYIPANGPAAGSPAGLPDGQVGAQPAWRPMEVADRVRECTDVISLRLVPAAGGPLPRWQPGAHLRITLPSGLIRHYSLCGDREDRTSYTIAVRRLSGAGSAEMFDAITAGSALRVLGPRNGFPFGAEPVLLFIAGGIGITPLLPMAREAAALGLDWQLVYRGRSPDTMPFADQVRAIDPARVSLLTGTGHRAADLVGRAPRQAAVYCCGPPSLIDEVRACFAGALHFERFTPAPIVDGFPFTVQTRGRVFDVPADRSILDVLLEADRAMPYSCRQGFCGTCRQRVLGGTVDHRDRHLTDAERAAGDVLVCVSRAAAAGERLVLDR
jgi:ferredoxin-NADP reductase